MLLTGERGRGMGKLIDLTGRRFGRLTVIEFAGMDKGRKSKWRCRCDCGKEIVVTSYSLQSGHTQSCGCFRRDALSKSDRVRKTRLYRIWSAMKDRCYNPRTSNYDRYGGRGIRICDDWIHDFLTFREWALKAGYDESAPRGSCTIDRIDNDGPYSPDNCRWVSMKVQRKNQRPAKHK